MEDVATAVLERTGRLLASGGKAVARGGRTIGVQLRRGGSAVVNFTTSGGAGKSGLARLVHLQFLTAAGDATVAVSLAGTLFFTLPTDQARPQVAQFLLLTMAPFAIVAPFIGPFLDRKHPPGEVAGLFIGKAIYYSWAILIPLLVVEVAWWHVAFGFLVMNLVAGTILGVVFQLAHVVEDITYPTPDDAGAMSSAWMAHELQTTSNFGRRNWLLCWYVGGLNFQVEHHLFPKVCSIHYPAISGIVEETALAHGLPYNHHATLREAIRSHYRSLALLGRQPLAAAA